MRKQPFACACLSVCPDDNFRTNDLLPIVRAVRGIFMKECANLYKSMNIGTLVIFDMLCPNLPGAKANSQRCRHY